MAVLDSLIRLKQFETQQRQQDVNALGSALGTFIQSKNQAQDRDLDRQLRRAQIGNLESQIQQRGAANPRRVLKENLEIQNLAATVRQKNILEQMLGPQITGDENQGQQSSVQQPSALELTGISGGSPQFSVDTVADKFSRGLKLRQEFQGLPEIKTFQTIRGNVASMDELLDRAKGGDLETKNALDNALIKFFEKITDPTSVVRESEFARTPENIPLVNRLPGLIDKVFQGGAGLTDSDREDLVKASKVIANTRGKIFNQELARFSDIAKASKTPEEFALGGIEKFEPFQLEETETEDLMNKAFEGLE